MDHERNVAVRRRGSESFVINCTVSSEISFLMTLTRSRPLRSSVNSGFAHLSRHLTSDPVFLYALHAYACNPLPPLRASCHFAIVNTINQGTRSCIAPKSTRASWTRRVLVHNLAPSDRTLSYDARSQANFAVVKGRCGGKTQSCDVGLAGEAL